MSLTHEKVATLPDEPGAEVNKAEWNAGHHQSGPGMLGKSAPGAGAVELLDGAAVLSFSGAEASGTAAAAVAAHAGAADPHIGYQKEIEKDAAGGYAGLDGGGKINPVQLPAIAISDTFVVASEAAMLATTAETGDVAVRTDTLVSYILRGTDPTLIGDWELLRTPTDVVQSVAGKTGVVLLVKGDVGLGNVDNTSDANKPVSTAQQTALDLKANLADAVVDGDAAGGDLGGTYPSPTVTQARGLRETAGPTTLVVGAVADGEFLRRVGATLVGAAPGAGSTDIKATTVTVATPALEASFTVTDAGVSTGSQIIIGWGNCAQSDANHPGMGQVGFNAVAGTGDFTVELYSLDQSKLFGAFKLNYLVG